MRVKDLLEKLKDVDPNVILSPKSKEDPLDLSLG